VGLKLYMMVYSACYLIEAIERNVEHQSNPDDFIVTDPVFRSFYLERLLLL